MKRAKVFTVSVFVFVIFTVFLSISVYADMSISELKELFPQDKYWNHIVQSGHGYINGVVHYGDKCGDVENTYTDHPCTTHTGVAGVGGYDCNCFDGSIQCCGFAKKIANLSYGGQNCLSWNRITDKSEAINTMKRGDIIHYYGAGADIDFGHWAMIIKVSGSTITVGECNIGNERCKISWNRSLDLSKTTFSSEGQPPITLFQAPYEQYMDSPEDYSTLTLAEYLKKCNITEVSGSGAAKSSTTKIWEFPWTDSNTKKYATSSAGSFRIHKKVLNHVGNLWFETDGGYIWSGDMQYSAYFLPYSGKESIGQTTATMARTLYTSGVDISKIESVGFVLYDSSGTRELGRKSETPTATDDHISIWYTIGSGKEINYALSAGTTYKYKFFASVDTGTACQLVESDMLSFTTNGAPPNRDPLGYFDGIESGNGTIRVTGWAYDPDCPNDPISIHAYVGGDSASGEGHDLGKTTEYREDVNKAFGISGNHGFDFTFHTDLTGNQPVYIYALDSAGGNNPEIGSKTVVINNVKTYTVTYNANGGSGAPASQNKNHGQTLTLSSTVPTRDGYIFLGWAKTTETTKPEYQPGDSYTEDADVTLYAVWEKNYIASGECGDNLTWTIDGTGTLTISGTGVMDEYIGLMPWGRFDECMIVSKIVMEDGITSIAPNAFNSLYNARELTIGKDVETIGTNFATLCLSLETIDIAEDNAYFSAVDGVLFDKEEKTLILCPGAKYGEYSIPDGTENIQGGAFSACRNLTVINIPASVTSIGEMALTGTVGAHAFFNVAEKNTICKSVNGSLFSKDGSVLIACQPNGERKYTVPASVTSFGQGAFSNCNSLTEIELHDGITSLASGLFFDCSRLESIILPDNENITAINTTVFYNCSSLREVTIPAGVRSIGNGAFDGCTALETINFLGTEDEWNRISIGAGNEPLTNAAKLFKSASTLILPAGLKKIDAEAFMGVTAEVIVVPESVTEIGNRAFADCKNLRQVIFLGTPDSIAKDYLEGSENAVEIKQ